MDVTAESLRATQEPPLAVDLDNSLLRASPVIESCLALLRERPQRLLAPYRLLSAGRRSLEEPGEEGSDVDVSALPYDGAVLELIESERTRGRRVVLVSSQPRRLAQRIADYLQVSDVLTLNDGRASASNASREALVAAYGPGGFDYVGSSRRDRAACEAARRAYWVRSRRAEADAPAGANVAGVLHSASPTVRDWISALRVHQWLKNLLLFVPMLAAHRFLEPQVVASALVAFLSFSLCASGAYIVNDLLDLHVDRHHVRKRFRPFASGRLSVPAGLVAFALLLVCAFGLAAWWLPREFVGGLAAYFALTSAYSMSLKRRMVIDVIALAGLYTLRVVLGAVAIGVPLSFWLLAFSMFMFLSLALVKREAELFTARAQGRNEKTRGRGYFPDDIAMIASLGAAAGYMAVMVLALYINDAHTTQLYRHPEIIWLACPLLLTWISRVWMLAHRGLMNEDPVVFAAKDRISLGIAALLLLVFMAAS